jgi:vitamin K-dependent gamma-carboxylase-like protein
LSETRARLRACAEVGGRAARKVVSLARRALSPRSWCAPASPVPLALLRIGVAAVILFSPEPTQALRIASGPRELWLAPPGMGWFLPIFAWFAPHLVLLRRLLWASALLSLLGLWTRASLGVLALTFFVLFGGAQLNGAVVHDMHLGWLLLVLFLGPSSEALSLDAWARGQRLSPSPASPEAGLATRIARLLLGCVYFFPGLHKLLDAGLDWASSHNLQNQLWLKWFQAGGVLPWPRVDHWPAVLGAGGVAVLFFELSFVACMASRRGRVLGGVMGLAFHALTQHFMYIRFPSLWACYGVLWAGPSPSRTPPGTSASVESTAPGLRVWVMGGVGVVLLGAVVAQGLRGDTQAWPFACYPSFSRPAPDVIVDLAVELTVDAPPGDSPGGEASGPERVLRIGPLPPAPGQPRAGRSRAPSEWSSVWTLAGVYGAPVSPARLQAFASELALRAQPSVVRESVRRVRFYVETYATAPENYGRPPLSRTLIHEAAAL